MILLYVVTACRIPRQAAPRSGLLTGALEFGCHERILDDPEVAAALDSGRIDVIANQVGISGGGFESDNNAATAFWQDG